MSKYVPPSDQGKAFVVQVWRMGKLTDHLVYATDAHEARYASGYGRSTNHTYVTRTRRATPADVARLGLETPVQPGSEVEE